MLDHFACNCLNVIIATEYTKGPIKPQELTPSEDSSSSSSQIVTDLHGCDPASLADLPFHSGIIFAKLGIGGIKIEHKYLTEINIVNSLQVTKCFICQLYTHAVQSSDSLLVFINSNLRKINTSSSASSSANTYENNESICPLKVSLSSAVKPNSVFAGKSALELHRMLFANNNMKKHACAIDVLIARASRLNDEAQKQCENEIRLFSEKAHEKYKAKQLATNASMDILAQLIASMDNISEESVAEKVLPERVETSEEKATESDAINSLGLEMEEQRMAQRGIGEGDAQLIFQKRLSLSTNGYATTATTTNNTTANNVNDSDDVLGDMEFNAYDDLPLEVNRDSKSPSSNEVEDENIVDEYPTEDDVFTEAESRYGPLEDLPSQGPFYRQVSQDIRMRGRRGSINSPGDGRVPLSRSVPINVPCDKRTATLSAYTPFANCPKNFFP